MNTCYLTFDTYYMADDDLYNLEYLSLIAKIAQEIDNYIGLSDKTLAEFVVSLHDQSKDLSEFKRKFKEIDPSAFPDSSIENIDRLILSLHPKHRRSKRPFIGNSGLQTEQDKLDEQDKRKRLFPGLALPDKEITKDVLMKEVDDMMAQFEGASKKRTRVEEGGGRPNKMERRTRSRSRSPLPRRRSPTPDKSHPYKSRQGDRDRGRSRAPLDERPVLYKIYNGRVSGMKDFGAFVQLEGVAGRVEGTCVLLLPNT